MQSPHSRKRSELPLAKTRSSDAPDRRAARKPVNLHRCVAGTPWDAAPVDYDRRVRFVRPASADLWPPRHLEVVDKASDDLSRIVIAIAAAVLAVGLIVWLLP